MNSFNIFVISTNTIFSVVIIMFIIFIQLLITGNLLKNKHYHKTFPFLAFFILGFIYLWLVLIFIQVIMYILLNNYQLPLQTIFRQTRYFYSCFIWLKFFPEGTNFYNIYTVIKFISIWYEFQMECLIMNIKGVIGALFHLVPGMIKFNSYNETHLYSYSMAFPELNIFFPAYIFAIPHFGFENYLILVGSLIILILLVFIVYPLIWVIGYKLYENLAKNFKIYKKKHTP